MSKTENPDGQDDVDAIFGEIVAGLRADGVGSGPRPDTDKPAASRPTQAPATDESGWRSGEVGWDETMLSGTGPDNAAADDDEHFVPPDPPPLPRMTGSMLVVVLFFVTGLLLLIAPGVIGMASTVATPLGILSLAAGLGFLLLHARDDPRPPPGSDPDTGAQV